MVDDPTLVAFKTMAKVSTWLSHVVLPPAMKGKELFMNRCVDSWITRG